MGSGCTRLIYLLGRLDKIKTVAIGGGTLNVQAVTVNMSQAM